jgi:hypothetical protein
VNQIPYQSGIHFPRTQAERDDPVVVWRRPNREFFASGACHILAYALVNRMWFAGYRLIYLRPTGDFPGQHVYATNGEWALDAAGWTLEAELLAVTKAEYSAAHPGWDYVLEQIDVGIEDFCERNGHRLPEDFAKRPWKRAHVYLTELGYRPPTTAADQS